MKKLSIIIPVFNEEQFIRKTLLSVIDSNTPSYQKEIVVIDDGSTDRSLDEIRSFEKELKTRVKKTEFKIISKKTNSGKGSAVKEGILNSSGDIVLIQDADLEYSPSDYPLLLEPFEKNQADVVYGSRFISNKPHRVLYFWHYQANVLLTTLSNMLTNLNLTDMEAGYKTFRGDLIRDISKELQSKRFGFEPEITARIAKIKGIKIYEVGISYYGRTYEEGKKITWKDGIRAVWEILKFNI